MQNDRRGFLKEACRFCLLGAVTFSAADLLSSCGTASKGFTASAVNNRVEVPLSLFNSNSFQVISPKNFDYEIAVQKNPDNTFRALLLRCTHHDNQLVATGNGYYCSLHGSQFSKQGTVTKGPAEKPLPVLVTETTPTNLIIHI
ncbi:ubiquinol-cytochrome c reductase iron-sulfur subunit [Chitinophaga sp. Cy-1792]|uniref:QcrA and Rieske domain-containing protein n=1 Tax=Chitinophaga sp. Cy-1792 TaxID=2608339 RepID=UPI00141FA785|nr:Rieske (2Fe-2S) protein [Chitinophaga sp. Cy-1792]NIG55624.1 Rieske (2Fe-2S) protein [Chitinophaga sp. Cy-1792]